MRPHCTRPRAVTAALPLLLGACASIGPSTVSVDRFDYNQAISRSANEQMLLNLVRLRYSEVPVFLGVGSVLAQYVVAGSLNAGAGVGDSLGEEFWDVGVSGTARYIERPTITYQPLTGQEFAAHLTVPVPGELVFSLVHSGWPPDQLLSMCIHRFNGLFNPALFVGEADEVQVSREFTRAMQLIIALAGRQALEIQRQDDQERQLVLGRSRDDETMAMIAELRQLAGLSAEHSAFTVTTRVVGRGPDEVTIRIRSVLELMGYLARGVQVPEEHLQQRRATGANTPPDADRTTVPLRVLAARERPDDAFVAVRYEGYWFYLGHADSDSKRAFGLLSYLFQMQAPVMQGGTPLVTVPAG